MNDDELAIKVRKVLDQHQQMESALKQIFAYASQARPRGYELAITKIEEISEKALLR